MLKVGERVKMKNWRKAKWRPKNAKCLGTVKKAEDRSCVVEWDDGNTWWQSYNELVAITQHHKTSSRV